jgi:hypothetical protein
MEEQNDQASRLDLYLGLVRSYYSTTASICRGSHAQVQFLKIVNLLSLVHSLSVYSTRLPYFLEVM